MASKKSSGIGSLRHIQIDKDNSYIVIAVAAAAACLIFSLVAAQSLWKQAGYNSRVISKMEGTKTTMEGNVTNLKQLEQAYQAFVQSPTNVIEGTATGQGDRDGDNSKIVLDAMPSVYDFPGTMTGLNKILNTGEFGETKISATDDELSQKSNTVSQITELPINFSGAGNVDVVQSFLQRLDNSIRPVKLSTVNFSGSSETELTVNVSGFIYYQPKKEFQVKSEVVE